MRKELVINGFEVTESGAMQRKVLNVNVTSDKMGKTLSINNGKTQFTIPLEKVLKELEKNQ